MKMVCQQVKGDYGNEKTFIDAIDNAQIKYDVDREISNKIYISDEDKLMRDNNINWTQSEIIKKQIKPYLS